MVCEKYNLVRYAYKLWNLSFNLAPYTSISIYIRVLCVVYKSFLKFIFSFGIYFCYMYDVCRYLLLARYARICDYYYNIVFAICLKGFWVFYIVNGSLLMLNCACQMIGISSGKRLSGFFFCWLAQHVPSRRTHIEKGMLFCSIDIEVKCVSLYIIHIYTLF